jgi:hypothetical protein
MKKATRFPLYPHRAGWQHHSMKCLLSSAICITLWQGIAISQETPNDGITPVPKEVTDEIEKFADRPHVEAPAAPADLLDEAHIREESGLNEFTAPSIAKIFDSLQSLAPLPIADCKREIPKRMPLDRADLAIEIGFLIADGFLIVQNSQMGDVEALAKELSRYGKGLGAGEKVSRHAASLLQSAKDNNVDQLKKELTATQKDVENELVGLRDTDLAHLISLGGWLRALQVSATSVDKQFSLPRAKEIMREDIADYYTEMLGSLHPDIAARPNVVRMREILSDLRNTMFFDETKPPTQQIIADIRKSANDLITLASLRIDK